MKARNEIERTAERLSKTLPPISEKQKQWAKDHCFKPVGYCSRGDVWCTKCGKVHKITVSPLGEADTETKVICPYCGAALLLENSTKRKLEESWYFTILTTRNGFQVIRHFIIEKRMYKVKDGLHGCEQPFYAINEAVQIWLSPEGKDAILARPCKPMPHVYDAWKFDEPMAIKRRRPRTGYSSCGDYDVKFDVHAEYIYPRTRVLPILRRNGYTSRINVIAPSELMKRLLTDNEAEMLMKSRQYELLSYKSRRNIGENNMPFPHAIRIANRNGYIIRNADTWFDYLKLLTDFNLDTHNAHYVCSENLEVEHDRLVDRKRRIEAAKAAEKKRREAAEWEVQYHTDKAKYLGICFGDENLVVTVIQSVAEMLEEGTAMHHCVYAAEYFKRPESLILSAKDTQGNRVETIEVSLQTFSVVQSRGVCNKNTPFHEEIINLVNQNMNKIKQLTEL